MPDNGLAKRIESLEERLTRTDARIRRYSIDPRLREFDLGPREKPTRPEEEPPGPAAILRQRADDAFKECSELQARLRVLANNASENALNELEHAWTGLERKVDLIQRELVSKESLTAGVKTTVWLVVALVALGLAYYFTHWVSRDGTLTFEPLPEWGPLKYLEVAFWAEFGALCSLLHLCTWYLSRRDFDRWFQPWYLSTALRAPFLTGVLMLVVLEFAEWYGEGKWIETYLLEEGNKFYFIVFMSFCLGLSTDRTSRLAGKLAGGVGDFVERVVSRVSQKFTSFVSSAPESGKTK